MQCVCARAVGNDCRDVHKDPPLFFLGEPKNLCHCRCMCVSPISYHQSCGWPACVCICVYVGGGTHEPLSPSAVIPSVCTQTQVSTNSLCVCLCPTPPPTPDLQVWDGDVQRKGSQLGPPKLHLWENTDTQSQTHSETHFSCLAFATSWPYDSTL